MPIPPPLEMSQSLEDFEQQNRPRAPQFPEPGPGDVVEDPFAGAPLEYFESVGPIKEDIIWNGKKVPVEFNLLDIAAERQLAADVSLLDGPEQIIAERQWRIAQALHSVNGKRIFFSPNWVEDQTERMNWAERFEGTLLYALSMAYERAANKPLMELGRLQTDPK